jgi:hypothetical protein
MTEPVTPNSPSPVSRVTLSRHRVSYVPSAIIYRTSKIRVIDSNNLVLAGRAPPACPHDQRHGAKSASLSCGIAAGRPKHPVTGQSGRGEEKLKSQGNQEEWQVSSRFLTSTLGLRKYFLDLNCNVRVLHGFMKASGRGFGSGKKLHNAFFQSNQSCQETWLLSDPFCIQTDY